MILFLEPSLFSIKVVLWMLRNSMFLNIKLEGDLWSMRTGMKSLMYYNNGETKALTNFGASKWEVKDDVAVWIENGFFYACVSGEKTEVARYIPKDYLIKNDVVVFRNLMGGVSAFVNGKVISVTTQMNSEYEIYGSSILSEIVQ